MRHIHDTLIKRHSSHKKKEFNYHHYNKEYLLRYDEEFFDKKIFPKMSADEQHHLMILSVSGLIQIRGDEWVVLMGSKAISRLYDYRAEMIDKYKHYDNNRQSNK